MNETKHTPGPWEVTKADRPFKFLTVFSAETGLNVCAMDWTDNADRQGRHEADARLIAAAPELLEALKNLHRLDEATNGVDYGKYERAMQAAKAAIAKAEGRA